MRRTQPIVAPQLDLEDVVVVVSAWLAPLGAVVVEGDRLVELLAGDVTVDVSAPAGGILTEKTTAEDAPVTPGQILGWIGFAD